jgi:hypothetical protein
MKVQFYQDILRKERLLLNKGSILSRLLKERLLLNEGSILLVWLIMLMGCYLDFYWYIFAILDMLHILSGLFGCVKKGFVNGF